MVYNILEVANTHGGNFEYMISLIDEFKEFDQNTGIKFQPFKYNEIALPDFSWYHVYKELFFSSEQWAKIISKASKHKDIWIDVFDIYSIKIIKENFDKIYGFKFQASVLFNKDVITELSKLNLVNKKIILNISGYEIIEIKKLVSKFKLLFGKAEILLQIGFQGYPTKIDDSGLAKVKIIKSKFDNQLVFADHIDAELEDALWLPVIANILGVNIIEKHVKHSMLHTKYDYYSSLAIDRYKDYIKILNRYNLLSSMDFITNEEKVYLKKSDQIPILKINKHKGELLCWDDFNFKRTDEIGLNTRELEKMLTNGYYLAVNKLKDDTITKQDINKATIATIIAVRLKSSRLEKKALKKIGKLSSIEYCVKNALKFENVNHTIIATSNLDQDQELENYTYGEQVLFHRGDPDDVIKRYLDIIRELKINVIVRVTGDMPFISNDILQILLKSHFKTGADYTVAREAAVGTNLEIINAVALEEVQEHFPNADYSEYMTWYFQNNPEHFKLNFVDLPKNLIRDYRLTLDYEEDLIMFNKINDYFEENKLDYNINSLFDFLDKNDDVSTINSKLTLKYKTDKELIETLNKVTKIPT